MMTNYLGPGKSTKIIEQKRVSDSEADLLVKTKCAVYCTKVEWKQDKAKKAKK